MKIYDQHVHTELSFDSKEKFSKYLEKCKEQSIDTFVSTEHLDLDSRPINKDIIPDFKLQKEMIEQYRRDYNINILMGIEVGYKPSTKERNLQVICSNEFDVVLLSIHESEETDVNTPAFLEGRNVEEIYREYLSMCITAVEEFDDFDIFTHVDYMLRYTDRVDIRIFQKEIDTLCKALICKNKTLEFNTRFLYGYNDSIYNRFIFRRYFELGGKNVSIGSDSHAVEFFFGAFDEAEAILKGIGFTGVTVYQNRKSSIIEF